MMQSKLTEIFSCFASSGRLKTVSLEENPFDLRPAFNLLQTEIKKRAKKNSLMVLMAEDHGCPMHIALRQGLMARLLDDTSSSATKSNNGNDKKPGIAYGIEWEKTILENIIQNEFGYSIPDNVVGQIIKADEDGQRLLRAFLAGPRKPVDAPETYRNLLAFCYERQIPVRAHDVERWCDEKEQYYMDLPESGLEQSDILLDEAEGMALRNEIMARRSLEHMEESGTDIYILESGSDHVVGNEELGYSFSDSLSNSFSNAVDVLPVFITGPHFTYNIPLEAREFIQEKGVIIEGGQHNRHFSSKSPAGTEMAVLKKMEKNSGGEIPVIPDKTAELRSQVEAEIPNWINEAKRDLSVP